MQCNCGPEEIRIGLLRESKEIGIQGIGGRKEEGNADN